jgi:two-component system, response regulator PdtaR
MVAGRILVVEDEHIVAMGIRVMLKNLGYTVTDVASFGEEAINKAESTLPDLVLMDILLKGDIDGIEASKEITSRLGVPVVYLTACSDHKILERVWSTGAGYIKKPFDEMDLKKEIDVVLSQLGVEKTEVKRDPKRLQKGSETPRSPPSSLYGPDGSK